MKGWFLKKLWCRVDRDVTLNCGFKQVDKGWEFEPSKVNLFDIKF